MDVCEKEWKSTDYFISDYHRIIYEVVEKNE